MKLDSLKQLIREEYSKIVKELSPDTMLSAASKLKSFGHSDRANKILDTVFSKSKNKPLMGSEIEKITFNITDSENKYLSILLKDGTEIYYNGRRELILVRRGGKQSISKKVKITPADESVLTDILSKISDISIKDNFIVTDNIVKVDFTEFFDEPLYNDKITNVEYKTSSSGNDRIVITLENNDQFIYLQNRDLIITKLSGQSHGRIKNVKLTRGDVNKIIKIIKMVNPETSISPNKDFSY